MSYWHVSFTTRPTLYWAGWAGTLQNCKLQIANSLHFFYLAQSYLSYDSAALTSEAMKMNIFSDKYDICEHACLRVCLYRTHVHAFLHAYMHTYIHTYNVVWLESTCPQYILPLLVKSYARNTVVTVVWLESTCPRYVLPLLLKSWYALYAALVCNMIQMKGLISKIILFLCWLMIIRTIHMDWDTVLDIH